MATSTARQLLGLSALLAALAACSTPTPRGYADQGIVYPADRTTHNAAYYQGTDPSFRGGKGSGGP